MAAVSCGDIFVGFDRQYPAYDALVEQLAYPAVYRGTSQYESGNQHAVVVMTGPTYGLQAFDGGGHRLFKKYMLAGGYGCGQLPDVQMIRTGQYHPGYGGVRQHLLVGIATNEIRVAKLGGKCVSL